MTKRYYVAVFGEPGLLGGKPPFANGRYPVGSGRWPAEIRPGDVVMVYCTAKFPGYPKMSPGFGVIYRVDTPAKTIYYRFLKFTTPMAISDLRRLFSPGDKPLFDKIRFKNFWLSEITEASFLNVVVVKAVAWV